MLRRAAFGSSVAAVLLAAAHSNAAGAFGPYTTGTIGYDYSGSNVWLVQYLGTNDHDYAC